VGGGFKNCFSAYISKSASNSSIHILDEKVDGICFSPHSYPYMYDVVLWPILSFVKSRRLGNIGIIPEVNNCITFATTHHPRWTNSHTRNNSRFWVFSPLLSLLSSSTLEVMVGYSPCLDHWGGWGGGHVCEGEGRDEIMFISLNSIFHSAFDHWAKGDIYCVGHFKFFNFLVVRAFEEF